MSGEQQPKPPSTTPAAPVPKTFELGERVIDRGEVAIVTSISKTHVGLCVFTSAETVFDKGEAPVRAALLTVEEAQKLQSVG
jgi:hypothetical protein